MSRVTSGRLSSSSVSRPELPGEAGEKVEAGSARSWGADAEQALSFVLARRRETASATIHMLARTTRAVNGFFLQWILGGCPSAPAPLYALPCSSPRG